MDKRSKIGLIFSYNENWIGGTYYIFNIIHSLNTLEDFKKPELIIFAESNYYFEKVKIETNYPYLTFQITKIKYSLIEKFLNRLSVRFLSKFVFDRRPKFDLCFIYPFNSYPSDFFIHLRKKAIHWIPDFQEHFFPDFFSAGEISSRKIFQEKLVHENKPIVFSSNNTQTTFMNLYPNNSCKTKVLSFSVSHNYILNQIDSRVIEKYNLPKHFFLAPNQFWKHKNQILLLKTIKALKTQGSSPPYIVFSGKEWDHRDKNYPSELKEWATINAINNYVSFLGFIPKNDLISLLVNSIAIVQPSLFEGWSTVIEDAKAFGKQILASDIEVHREQLKEYPGEHHFFDPNSEDDLVNLFAKLGRKNCDLPISNNFYKRNVKDFAENFIESGELLSDL